MTLSQIYLKHSHKITINENRFGERSNEKTFVDLMYCAITKLSKRLSEDQSQKNKQTLKIDFLMLLNIHDTS